jgi:hypothetical protein
MQTVFTVQVGHIPKPPPGFCQAAGLFDCTVGRPTPLAVRIESHIGLHLDPIRTRSEDRRASQVDGEGAGVLREWLVGGAKNLRARKTPVIGVEEDVETSGGSRTIEVYPISIDGLHIPSLTSGHHKVVGEIGVKVGKSVNVADKLAAVEPLLY